jgi:hypothetical protein
MPGALRRAFFMSGTTPLQNLKSILDVPGEGHPPGSQIGGR